MQLRPHHLLCTQGYSGKGYDDAFVANMTSLTDKLRQNPSLTVDLVYSTDDLCACCPNQLAADTCKVNQKVKTFDAKVVSYFGLEEKTYVYADIIKKINRQMTPEMMDDICGSCEWYPVSACRKNILGESAAK